MEQQLGSWCPLCNMKAGPCWCWCCCLVLLFNCSCIYAFQDREVGPASWHGSEAWILGIITKRASECMVRLGQEGQGIFHKPLGEGAMAGLAVAFTRPPSDWSSQEHKASWPQPYTAATLRLGKSEEATPRHQRQPGGYHWKLLPKHQCGHQAASQDTDLSFSTWPRSRAS